MLKKGRLYGGPLLWGQTQWGQSFILQLPLLLDEKGILGFKIEE